MFVGGKDIRDKVYKWAPEVAAELSLQSGGKIETGYDTFNVDKFWSFCKMTKVSAENSEHKYPFADLERNDELDKLVVGFWIKNHVEFKKMEDNFKIQTEVRK
jgi:hypothetical protein